MPQQEAQARYEREVVAHGQAMKSVTELREQIGGLQARARDGEHEAEKAQGLLKVQATQFQTQKDILERELNDMRERNKSLSSQNTILHDQLESITAQASRIRQVADSDMAQLGPDVQANELQSLISFLRKENDIAQASLDLAKSQNSHLQTEIKELNAALDESRTRLAEVCMQAFNVVISLRVAGTREGLQLGCVGARACRAARKDQPAQYPAREQLHSPCG